MAVRLSPVASISTSHFTVPAIHYCPLLQKTMVKLAFLLVPATANAASPAWLTAHDADIRQLVGKMTLAEKVGQMTQPDLGSIKDVDDVKTLCLGSVLSGGGSDPKSGNTLADWLQRHIATYME